MGLHKNWHKTKIQNIGTGVAPRTVSILTIKQQRQYPGLHTWALTQTPMATPTRDTDAWALLVPLWLNLTVSGVSKDLVSPPSSEYTPLLCSQQCYMAPKRGLCAKQTVTGSSLFTCRHCIVYLVSGGMTRYPMQQSMRERNYQTYRLLLLTDVIHYLVTFVAYRRTHLLRKHCNCRQKPTPALPPPLTGSTRWVSTKKLAATSGRRHWSICWCCPDRGPGSFDVEDATTISWSSAAVSE